MGGFGTLNRVVRRLPTWAILRLTKEGDISCLAVVHDHDVGFLCRGL
jgi:hypothetical protein